MAKGNKPTRDPKRFQRKVPSGPMRAPLTASPTPTDAQLCGLLEQALNEQIARACAKKAFEITAGNCAGGVAPNAAVDLVVVIDTSGSMSDEATELSAAADAAIQAAAKSCPSDLRVVWFGIEGTWSAHDPATRFTQSYRDYLQGLGVVDADLVGTPGHPEDGAAAVIDLAGHFDWRAGAARAVFLLGDEALEDGDPQDASDISAADSAVAAANLQGVTVFTYFGTPFGGSAATPAEYQRLAVDTGGQAFVAPVASLGGFQPVLENIICQSGGGACQAVDAPKLAPCIKLHWGDGPKDQIETDDFEILCLTVCNPYSNVVLQDFTLHLALTDSGGRAVPALPDGTPSVQIKPEFMICFGDIAPCDPEAKEPTSCVTRELVLRSCGAKPGKYAVFIAYCFTACFTKLGSGAAFELELVSS